MSRSILGELENTISPEAVAVDRLAQGFPRLRLSLQRCHAMQGGFGCEQDRGRHPKR